MARKWERFQEEHYIETQVENKVGEGRGGGREQEEELPHPTPPHPTQPNPPTRTRLSLWETGQVRMSGRMRVKARCGTTRGASHIQWGAPGGGATLMAIFGGASGVDGVWLTDGSAVSAVGSCILNTLEWFPLRHARGHKMWCTYPEFNIQRDVQPRMWSTNNTPQRINLTQ